jgi:hypothetical protein
MPKEFSKFDIALILVILPYILQLKLALFSFLIFALTLLIFKIKPNKFLLTLFAFLGFIIVWISYIEQFEGKFIGLDIILTFLGMIFLILMTTFRLNGQINAYLILSTFLVLVFSLHYYETIYTMLYSIFCIYSFLVLYLWHKQAQSLKESIIYTNKMILFSLPIVFILFLVFSKLDFKSFATSKMKSSRSATGFEGSLSLKNIGPLVPSAKNAFEVWFEGKTQNQSEFYFRGSVLYADELGYWKTKLDKTVKRKVETSQESKLIRYNINLFPNGRKWLYSLDYIASVPTKILTFSDGTILAKENINEEYTYNLRSNLNSNIYISEKHSKKDSLAISPHIAPKLYKETREISSIQKPQERLDSLIKYLSSKKLTYKLDVDRLKTINPIDEFLFESKEGYCVHFASLFATAAQYVNLPSRIVTGYITSPKQQIDNYIFVREKNAHAWTEIYLEGKGWIRFESTKLATGNINLYQEKEGLFYYTEKLSLYYQYFLHIVQETLLNLAYLLELDFLIEIFDGSGIILKSFLGFFFLIILSYLSIRIFLGNKRTHEKELKKLLKLLKKRGHAKLKGENIETFIKKVSQEKEEKIRKILLEINEHYHDWVYGEKKKLKKLL